MPELPEVETVRQTLRRNILGKQVSGITVLYERMIVGSSVEDFKEKLIGKTLIEIGRLGKYLFFEFSDDIYLISHLRMEGKYFIKNHERIATHEHVIFYLRSGKSLRYHDVRKFGTMKLVNTTDLDEILSEPEIKKLGLEAKLKYNINDNLNAQARFRKIGDAEQYRVTFGGSYKFDKNNSIYSSVHLTTKHSNGNFEHFSLIIYQFVI